jgi:hypothetical protein
MSEALTYALAFASTFAFIFLKSFQQLNVVHRKYWWIVPTSLLMAVCEVYVITVAATNGWGWIILPVGLGGGAGALIATYFHNRMFK